ncbi:MAG: hypothetical protein HGB00_03035 [Chlorobiaceae bacterium]|nr:hypothetical protein [Chlorobiaceae bacterium]
MTQNIQRILPWGRIREINGIRRVNDSTNYRENCIIQDNHSLAKNGVALEGNNGIS